MAARSSASARSRPPGKRVGRGALRLHADHSDSPLEVFGGEGHTADERGVSHGDEQDLGFRQLLQHFAGDGGCARRHVRIAAVLHEVEAVIPGEDGGAVERLGQVPPAFDDMCGQLGDACALDRVRIRGQEHRCRHPHQARRVGGGRAMITRTRGHHARHRPALQIPCQRRDRPARLERARGLLRLQLQENPGAGGPREGSRFHQPAGLQIGAHDFAGALDVRPALVRHGARDASQPQADSALSPFSCWNGPGVGGGRDF